MCISLSIRTDTWFRSYKLFFVLTSAEHELLIALGFKTCQPLWVILCRLLENGRREIEELVEEMKERVLIDCVGLNDT